MSPVSGSSHHLGIGQSPAATAVASSWSAARGVMGFFGFFLGFVTAHYVLEFLGRCK